MKTLMLTLSLFVPFFSLAAKFECPETIETEQKLSGVMPTGWESMNDTFNGKQRLENISVYSGHPKDGASLVPDKPESSKAPYWTFRKEVRGIWMACFYSQNTIRLIKELPQAVTKCTLKYKSKPKRVDYLDCQ